VFEFPKLWGGRGTKRPAGAGMGLALLDCPSGARFGAGVAVVRAGELPTLFGLAEPAAGVILLTVGREATPADGLAAGWPAFGPSMFSRVGEASGRLMLDRFRKELGETLTAFEATGRPRSRVFRETAVSAPGVWA
jgi:hypothetical protein